MAVAPKTRAHDKKLEEIKRVVFRRIQGLVVAQNPEYSSGNALSPASNPLIQLYWQGVPNL